MAHICKHPDGENKGLIVFTHKEMHYFQMGWIIKWIPRLSYKTVRLKDYYRNWLNKISKNYIIGIHFGSYHKTFPSYDFVDFYMSGKGTLEVPDPNVFFIPFNSRSFSSTVFQPGLNVNKYWDILCIARNAKFKKLDKFLKSIRKIYDKGYKYRIMLMIATPPNENPKKHYVQIEEDYYRMFTDEERDLFIMLKLSKKYSFLGVGSSFIHKLYQESKVFTLFSDVEGESRVISEALLCGLPVVVWDKLKGGGRDLLNSSNSLQFSNYENAHESLINAVENWQDFIFDVDELARLTREDFTIDSLKKYFNELYLSLSQEFDGELINTDNLANRLPAHDTNVPWTRGRFKTADILSRAQFRIFIDHLIL